MIWRQFGQSGLIRQETSQLVSSLSRWCRVHEDLLYAFQKSLEFDLKQPMRAAVESFLARVKGGMPVEQALNLLEGQFGNEQFKDLVAAIRFNLVYRGNLAELLSHLEWQMTRIEEEYIRRKLSQARDRRLTIALLSAVPLICLVRLLFYPSAVAALFRESAGRIWLGVGFCFYLVSLIGFLLVEKKMRE